MNKKKKVGKKYAFEREVYKNVARVRVQRFTGVVGNVSKKRGLDKKGAEKRRRGHDPQKISMAFFNSFCLF